MHNIIKFLPLSWRFLNASKDVHTRTGRKRYRTPRSLEHWWPFFILNIYYGSHPPRSSAPIGSKEWTNHIYQCIPSCVVDFLFDDVYLIDSRRHATSAISQCTSSFPYQCLPSLCCILTACSLFSDGYLSSSAEFDNSVKESRSASGTPTPILITGEVVQLSVHMVLGDNDVLFLIKIELKVI